jgi:hypothetical protein
MYDTSLDSAQSRLSITLLLLPRKTFWDLETQYNEYYHQHSTNYEYILLIFPSRFVYREKTRRIIDSSGVSASIDVCLISLQRNGEVVELVWLVIEQYVGKVLIVFWVYHFDGSFAEREQDVH